MGIFRSTQPAEKRITRLAELLEHINGGSDDVRRAAFSTYLREAETASTASPPDALVDRFEQAQKAMGPSLRPQEFHCSEILWNITRCHKLLHQTPSENQKKRDQCDREILDCIRRIVAIASTLSIKESVRELAIRFMFKGALPGIGRYSLLSSTFRYWSAKDIAETRRGQPPAELHRRERLEWRDQIWSHSHSLEQDEFRALLDIELALERLP